MGPCVGVSTVVESGLLELPEQRTVGRPLSTPDDERRRLHNSPFSLNGKFNSTQLSQNPYLYQYEDPGRGGRDSLQPRSDKEPLSDKATASRRSEEPDPTRKVDKANGASFRLRALDDG